MRRRAARKDANHNTITHAFIALGCSVRDGSRNADGWADLAVGLGGVTHLCEIKDGSKSPSRRKRTEAQVKWSAGWRGEIVHIVESVEDVQRLVGVWREQVVKSVFASAGVVSSAPPFDADDYSGRPPRGLSPGEWVPMPHKDSPEVKP